jgi:hypothetical protein
MKGCDVIRWYRLGSCISSVVDLVWTWLKVLGLCGMIRKATVSCV